MGEAHIQRADAQRLDASQTERVRRLRGREPDDFYPAKARADRIDGDVLVDLLINAEGFVVEASVLRESPPEQGFALAALDTVKTWEFDNPFRRLVLMEAVVRFLP